MKAPRRRVLLAPLVAAAMALMPIALKARTSGPLPLGLDETLLASTYDPTVTGPTTSRTTEVSEGERAALVSRLKKRGGASRVLGRIGIGPRVYDVWLGDFAVETITATQIQLRSGRVVVVSMLMSDFTERYYELRWKKSDGKFSITRRYRGRYGDARPSWARDPA